MEAESAHSAVFLYGPPGSGKSTIGQALAQCPIHTILGYG
jgi:shikimate kinase